MVYRSLYVSSMYSPSKSRMMKLTLVPTFGADFTYSQPLVRSNIILDIILKPIPRNLVFYGNYFNFSHSIPTPLSWITTLIPLFIYLNDNNIIPLLDLNLSELFIIFTKTCINLVLSLLIIQPEFNNTCFLSLI